MAPSFWEQRPSGMPVFTQAAKSPLPPATNPHGRLQRSWRLRPGNHGLLSECGYHSVAQWGRDVHARNDDLLSWNHSLYLSRPALAMLPES
jgi:hypothetical protein